MGRLAYFAFVAATIFSFVSEGPYTYHSVTAFLLYLLPLGFYVAPRGFSHGVWVRIFWALFIGGTVASLTVLYEFFVIHRPLIHSSTYLWNPTTSFIFRPGGVFGGPPQAAAALSMTALSGLALLVTTVGVRRRIVWVCLSLSVTALVVTFTRAGMVGFVVGALLFVLLWRPVAFGRLAYCAAALSIVFVVVVIQHLASSSWYQKGVTRQGTLADRENRWKLAWPLVTNSTQHLLIGHGVNALAVGVPNGLPGTPQPDLAAVPTILDTSPHSQYIRTLLEQGFVGLALLLAWLAGAVGKAAVAIRRRANVADSPFLAACAAGIVSFLVVCLVDDALSTPSSRGIVALLAGLIAVRCAAAKAPVQ